MEGLEAIEILAITQKLKQCYEELILGHPEFSTESRILNEYWEKIFYPKVKGQDSEAASVAEARGALISLNHCMTLGDSPLFSELRSETLICLGDLERYSGHKQIALEFYALASETCPYHGRAYSQQALLCTNASPSRSLLLILLALSVHHPFGGARENLRQALTLFTSKGNTRTSAVCRSISFVLLERLGGRKLQYGREKAEALTKGVHSIEEAHLLWLTLVLEPGLLDQPEAPLPVCLLLPWMAQKFRELDTFAKASPAYSVIWGLLKAIPHFISRSKRFEELWEPIVEALCLILNKSPSQVLLSDHCLLPEDAMVSGISLFQELPRNEDPIRGRQSRISLFTESLINAGLLYQLNDQEEGTSPATQYLNKSEFERQMKRKQTGKLLAKQRLRAEVEQMERLVPSEISTPWLIPDTPFLMSHWKDIGLAIDGKSERFIITLAVLAELDKAKSGSQLARTIIGRLSALSADHHPSIRLQKPDEKFSVKGGRFAEALAYYALDKKCQYRVLSEDSEILALNLIPAGV